MVQNASFYNFFKNTILFLFLFSMYPWVTWRIDQNIVWLIAVTIISAFYFTHKDCFEKQSVNKYLSTSLFLLIMWMQRQTIMAAVWGIGLWWSITVLLQLKLEYKKDIIDHITKYFGIMLAVSLGVFILSKLGIPFPHSIIDFNTDTSYAAYNNYYFYIQSTNAEGFRFYSIFLEPGHMTMGLAPLIYLNGYNLKNKYCTMLIIAQLFSFSLAGYLLLFFGYIWQLLTNSKQEHKVRTVFVSTLIFSIFIFLTSHFFEEDIFSTLILDRLKIEDGNIVGNDRMNKVFAEAFESYVASEEFLIGRGSYDAEAFSAGGHGNSGWQVFAFVYGLIGIIAVVLSYISPYLKQKNLMTLGFCLFLILMLMGNGYPTWWCVLIHLSIGAAILADHSNTCYLE